MKNVPYRKNVIGLYVLGSLYPYVTGGMEIFNYYFLNNRLDDAGDHIYYLGRQKTDNKNGSFIRLRKLWPSRIFYPVQFFITILKLRKKLDFVYICYAEQSWIISYSQSRTLGLFGIPYIVTNHWGKEPDWKFRYPFEYYFRHAHAVIGVSEPICIAFKKAIPDQDFQYIPPLIPFQRATGTKQESRKILGYGSDEKILLFVGSLKAMKNPDKILEALGIIGTGWLEEQRVRVIIAGKGELENTLMEMAVRAGVQKFISFPGLVTREDIPDYYNVADVYIISSDYEGTSLSLMEAMFNKLAIIASNAPGINGMLAHEQNALLYETKNANRLADTIKRIFSDPGLADRLATSAYAGFREKYSYESMIEKYMTIFSSV